MTKARAPLSVDKALSRIAGYLPGGFDDMAEIVGRQARTVRNWSDPDTPESIPVECAIALDLAYVAAGGQDTPIFDAYAHKMKAAADARFADEFALLRHAQIVAKETGEANSAIIGAAQPSATEADRRAAQKEIDEAIASLKSAIPLLSPQPP